MKRLLALLLTIVMVLSVAALAACNKQVTIPTVAPASSADDGGDAPASSDGAEETEAAPVEFVPLSPTAFSVNVGGYDLSFEPIDLGGVGGEGSHDFCGDYYDGKYYLADKNAKKVYVFSIDGTEATLDAEYDTEVGFEKVTVNHDGRVILSQGIFEAFELLSDGTFSELIFRHDLECSKRRSHGSTLIRPSSMTAWKARGCSRTSTTIMQESAICRWYSTVRSSATAF